jgi:stage II sporulation protein AA (anti-sigma F factor antagonist)
MKFEREIHGAVAVLSLRGEFDSFVVNNFLEEVEALTVSGIRHLILDMRTVKFIMSTAIGAIVKSRKQLKELGGELVIAQPSSFVRDVLESLGLTRVIRIFESNEAAVATLAKQPAEPDLPTGNSALLHFADADLQKKLGRPVLGRILELSDDGMSLRVGHPASDFQPGVEVRAKFRLPLFKRSYYFEIPSKVGAASPESEGTRLDVRFVKIESEDRESIQQFLKDMNFLRGVAKNPDA